MIKVSITNNLIVGSQNIGKKCLFLVVLFLTGLSSYAQNILPDYKYLLYLPKDYLTSDKIYPLMIYLGGGSQRGDDLNKLKTFGPPGLVAKGRDFDLIIVSPQCPDGKTWTSERWFDSLSESLLPKYRIDTNRIYVTGISIGGYGTWQVAMDYPDKFAAILPLCGGVNDSDTSNISKIKHLPVWTFHGTADDIIPLEETGRVVRKLKELGSPVRFTKIEDGDHGIQYLYENPEIYKWMLKQRKRK